MEIHHYHPATRDYLGSSMADESPLEPGVFLIPAYATTVPVPEPEEGFLRKFDGEAWGFVPDIAPEAEITPEPVVTLEQIRAGMPVLSMRQFRLGLLKANLLNKVYDAINGMPDSEMSVAIIEFEYATVMSRTHSFVSSLFGALGLTDEQVDSFWMSAAQIE